MTRIRLAISIFILLILGFIALVARCFYLQFFRQDELVSKAIRQQQKWTLEKPQRGPILDRRGRILAASNRIQNIFAEPRRIDEPERVATLLAPILHIEAREIYQRIINSKNPGFVRLKTNASESQCQAARRVDNGIGIESEWHRYYPLGRLACHIVGFVSTDNRGLDGIELLYDDRLKGLAGKSIFLADKSRRTVRLRGRDELCTDGQSIILTIDSVIQHFARTELEKQYRQYNAESAIAIVARPDTGEILAMVCLPDYDPNNLPDDPNCLRNRAITDQFEPGSMIKPIVVAIALDNGAVNTTERIFCENGHYSGKGFGHIGEYANHAYGNLTVRQIIVKSSNIGMAKIGQRLGKERLYEGLRLFGFGKKTGIDLPGEVPGLLRSPDKWTGYSITRIPFGHEITVTAIQMIRAFCILANGGHPIRPYVVKAIVDSDGTIVKLNRPPPEVGYVIKPEVANWLVRDALVGVVNEKQEGGTGWRAKLDNWQVFGKTGTANIARSDGKGYSQDDYVASFIGGAPAEDPEILVLVSIIKPDKSLSKGYTGGAVASPVVGRIIEKTLTYLHKQQ